jgi:hypothetical protein
MQTSMVCACEPGRAVIGGRTSKREGRPSSGGGAVGTRRGGTADAGRPSSSRLAFKLLALCALSRSADRLYSSSCAFSSGRSTTVDTVKRISGTSCFKMCFGSSWSILRKETPTSDAVAAAAVPRAVSASRPGWAKGRMGNEPPMACRID